MKIMQSTVGLYGEHAKESQRTTQTSLRVWSGNAPPTASTSQPGVTFSLSQAAKDALARSKTAASTNNAEGVSSSDSSPLEPKMRLLANMIEALTGQPVRIFQAQAMSREDARVAMRFSTQGQSMQSSSTSMELATYERVAEMESTRFSASGFIQTADGQEFAFDVELEMHRAYVQESYQSTRVGTQQAAPLTDPLVLQFDGTGVELQDMQFAFDLNVDGTAENIAMPAMGSGFLALDRNKNGVIDNGSELFGPQSGDGFADLAEHDHDGNGWIDESDPVFSQLRLWTADSQGGQSLSTLEQLGVGALYLGRVQTPFSVQTADQRTLGQVRSSGIFLTEAGDVKTMHQVDL